MTQAQKSKAKATKELWRTLAELCDSRELPELTQQQLGFVHGLLSGQTAAAAYRDAYNASGMQERTVWAEASRQRHHHKVSAWLAAARMAGLASAKITVDQHVAELDRLKEMALAAGNYGAAVQAEQLKGKALGHYVEKWENVTKPDPVKTLDEIAKINPAYAAELARAQGIQWSPPEEHETRH